MLLIIPTNTTALALIKENSKLKYRAAILIDKN